MKNLALVGLVGVLGTAASTNGFTFQCRFVERVGNNDVVLANNRIDVSDFRVHDIRLQFGVFDDATDPAPTGGFVGWNVGTMQVGGPIGDSDERRNPGRLSPFNFADGTNANGNPPLPAGDPFTMLTEIDATLGTQSPIWICDAQGNAPAQPEATVWGRNTFVSVFAFSIDPNIGSTTYYVDVRGNLIAATSWLSIGTPTAPDCGDPADPSDDIPGSVTYAPFATPPQAFACVLFINIIPAPGAAILFGMGGLFGARRGCRTNNPAPRVNRVDDGSVPSFH